MEIDNCLLLCGEGKLIVFGVLFDSLLWGVGKEDGGFGVFGMGRVGFFFLGVWLDGSLKVWYIMLLLFGSYLLVILNLGYGCEK